jgi:hypothetical protein
MNQEQMETTNEKGRDCAPGPDTKPLGCLLSKENFHVTEQGNHNRSSRTRSSTSIYASGQSGVHPQRGHRRELHE